MKIKEKEIIEFVKQNMNLTPEEIKKSLREKFPKLKFYNEEVENLIIKATSRESKLVATEDDFDR